MTLKHLKYFGLALISGILFVSCEKPVPLPSDYTLSKVNFIENFKIRDIQPLNDTLVILCGGKSYDHGYIYSSTNGGKTWFQTYSNDYLSINAVYGNHHQDTLWAAGDSLKIYQSTNKGQSWQAYTMSSFPYDEYKNPYYAIYAWSGREILAVGGEYYQKGITSKTGTGDWPWLHTSWDNQWFDLLVFNDNEVFVSGYGQVLYSNDKGNSFQPLNVSGDAFVELEKNLNDEIFLLGEHGKIYSYNEQTWEKVAKIKGSFNTMSINDRHILIGGQNGNLWIGNVHAENFKKVQSFTNANISVIKAVGNNFLIGCEDASLYYLSCK